MTDADGFPGPGDAKAWNDAAVAASVAQLTNVRALAGKWSAAVTGLIGVFGSVAVVSGASGLGDIRWQWVRVVIVVATIVAAGCAARSIVLTTKAATGGDPVPHIGFTGEQLWELVADQTPDAIEKLKAGRAWGWRAAAIVAALSVTALGAAIIPKGSASTTYLVVTTDGSTYCGGGFLTNGHLTRVADTDIAQLARGFHGERVVIN